MALDPKDKDALHCKAITLIRLERYTDVLSLLNRQLQGQFVFEKAYCLYRTNQLADGAILIENRRKELLSQGEPLPWDLRHLEAQMLYRMEKYQECIVLYAGMLQDTDKSDEGYNDILTNFNACKAAVLYSGESLDDKVLFIIRLSTRKFGIQENFVGMIFTQRSIFMVDSGRSRM